MKDNTYTLCFAFMWYFRLSVVSPLLWVSVVCIIAGTKYSVRSSLQFQMVESIIVGKAWQKQEVGGLSSHQQGGTRERENHLWGLAVTPKVGPQTHSLQQNSTSFCYTSCLSSTTNRGLHMQTHEAMGDGLHSNLHMVLCYLCRSWILLSRDVSSHGNTLCQGLLSKFWLQVTSSGCPFNFYS